MTLSFSTPFTDAFATWRRDSALLLPLVGLTMFLPQYAVLLLVPPFATALPERTAVVLRGGQADAETIRATSDAIVGWLASYGGWYLLAPAVGLFGGLVVTTLYLMAGRPTLGQALARAAALFLRYVLASILIGCAAAVILSPGALVGLLLAGLMPLAFYVLGRTMLVGPAIVDAAPLGAVAAIRRSWALTRGNGWLLGGTYAAPLFAAQLIGGALASLGALGGPNPVIGAIIHGVTAFVLATAGVTMALVEIALYRRLASKGT